MFRFISGAILAGGAVELVLLIAAGSRFGVLPVMAALVASGVIGFGVIRHFGMRSLAGVQNEIRATGAPGASLSQGVFGAMAGVLFILPGFLSDILAVLLLVPAVQRFVLGRFVQTTRGSGPTPGRASGRVIVIDAEATEIEPDPPPQNPPVRLK